MTGLIRTYGRLRHHEAMPKGLEPTGNNLGHHDAHVISIAPIGQPPIAPPLTETLGDEIGCVEGLA